MKEIVRVLEEVQRGPASSYDIADALGMPVKVASAYLSELCASGQIKKTPMKTKMKNGGRWMPIYEAA